MQSEAMAQRQRIESKRDRLDWSLKVDEMSADEVAKTRASLLREIEAAKQARAQAQAQLQSRQERAATRAAQNDAEVDVDVPAAPPRTGLGRKLSFTRKKKTTEAAAGGGGAQPAAQGGAPPPANGAGHAAASDQPPQQRQSTLTRVLSFGRRNKAKAPDGGGEGEAGEKPTSPRGSVVGGLVRKLSFSKRKPPPQ